MPIYIIGDRGGVRTGLWNSPWDLQGSLLVVAYVESVMLFITRKEAIMAENKETLVTTNFIWQYFLKVAIAFGLTTILTAAMVPPELCFVSSL